MCGRYALHASPEVVALQFGLQGVPELRPRYNICPGTEIFVVGNDRQARLLPWGAGGRFAPRRRVAVDALGELRVHSAVFVRSVDGVRSSFTSRASSSNAVER